MQHSDPDVLALVALGEPAPAADAAHIAGCPACRDEVAALGQVVATVRSDVDLDADLDADADADLDAGTAAAAAAEGGPAIAPPPAVWEGIAARTGVAVAPRPEVVAAAARPDTVVPLRRERGAGRRSQPGDPSRRRWSPRTRSLTLAVAASLLVGAAAGSLVTHAVTTPADPTQQVLAQVDLNNLKPKVTSASGHASVVETKAGQRLKVDVAALRPQAGHFYEVWLIDRAIKKMVPVGILAPGDDEFVIPDGVDISQYPVVDISVQQPGDPKHSGDSVLRGTISG